MIKLKKNIPYADDKKKKLLDDLFEVGISKAVGYLPLSTIKKIGGKKFINTLIEYAKRENLDYMLFEFPSAYSSPELYFYDIKMLNPILSKYKDVLQNAGIPTSPKEYIEYIHEVNVKREEYPEAHYVIAKTFDDKFNMSRIK